MRFKTFLMLSLTALALAGCNDTLDSVDMSKVRDKVQHPLSAKIVEKMKAKGMETQSPIMLRIFKEEGVLEVWKEKTNKRFELITDYKICAWSGKLGPKAKEGDRQAPEGFYPLSPGHMNPNSSYFLAINTGFPNKYDASQGRSGTNLMIHGACSSSGCYSMTDAQMLEIYAFARDAFKGGQQNVQLQAFPFRMTAENMARHRNNANMDFWKMLKVGYDQFEVTKRPPVVNVCEKKYVFNQQTSAGAQFNPTGQCPAMETPAPLMSAMATFNKAYDRDYQTAMKKYEGMVWYEPTENERKEIVKDKRKGRELAYAPTGSSLDAGRLMKASEFEKAQAPAATSTVAPAVVGLAEEQAKAIATTTPSSQTPLPRTPTPSATASAAIPKATPLSPAAVDTSVDAPDQTVTATTPTTPGGAAVPVPQVNPAGAPAATDPLTEASAPAKKPFWKVWNN
ncbi:hypothetical protein IFT84_13840 [Rhizobium sp. CFBP 8762]|uniref:L,D-transpeptidase family protein n=1 Tax=Rhizobium sp. CFBP 8762 TaxID=2775279 RepID=UPI0017802C6A|nr:murein L,D-transpeptidase family protein [Rhizobium sp. CFBP 8762]MBD8555588.1 hypothetical protein [Rhizobium sp. CFBP 8762]